MANDWLASHVARMAALQDEAAAKVMAQCERNTRMIATTSAMAQMTPEEKSEALPAMLKFVAAEEFPEEPPEPVIEAELPS